MKKRNSLVGLLTAILVGAMIAVGVQAFSGLKNTSDTEGIAVQHVPVKPITIVPVAPDQQMAKPMDITVGTPQSSSLSGIQLPPVVAPPHPDLSDIATPEPVPNAPALASLADNAPVLFAQDFNTNNNLDGWTFGQIYDEPTEAPAWSVNADHSTQNLLISPRNWQAMNVLNDVLAIPPITLVGNGAVEVSAFSRNAATMGLVANYVDDQNYVAMVFGTEDSRRMVSPGFSIIRVHEGSPQVLAYDNSNLMKHHQWYTLRLDIDGNVLKASIDGSKLLTATLSEPLTGQKVGLYAGSEGFVFFNNLRVTGK